MNELMLTMIGRLLSAKILNPINYLKEIVRKLAL